MRDRLVPAELVDRRVKLHKPHVVVLALTAFLFAVAQHQPTVLAQSLAAEANAAAESQQVAKSRRDRGKSNANGQVARMQPASRTARDLEGWKVLVDDRLLAQPLEQRDAPQDQQRTKSFDEELGQRAIKFLEAKLFEITQVVPTERLEELQRFTIVLDLECGDLSSMQYHPSAGWLKANGYPVDLAKCVHLPRAVDVATRRNINEQPWVVLHELAHAYHDQVLGFDHPEVIAAFEQYKASGRGDRTLLYNGRRVKHYALTDHKEFFAEMTESFFGVNDFYPFNRAELQESDPDVFDLLSKVWLASQ